MNEGGLYLLRSVQRFWKGQQGSVSVYLVLIIVPILLFCGVLIDVIRYKTAAKEGEQAVKAGLRSSMSAFSPQLQSYGLYGLPSEEEGEAVIFPRVVSANLSDAVDSSRFRFIDHRLEEGTAKTTPVYSLANHQVLKRQILEEMKYRAPMIYTLEISDKFKKSSLPVQLNQASGFGENAAKIEKLLEERDQELSSAWEVLEQLQHKSSDMHPFYKTQLRDLNELSGRIGIHTIEDVRATLQTAKQQVSALQEQIRGIDLSLMSLAQAGPAAVQSIIALNESKNALMQQLSEATQLVSQYEQLLSDLLQYAKLLAMLKLKAAQDQKDLAGLHEAFKEAMGRAKQANDQLNTELRRIQGTAAGSSYPSNAAFQSIMLVERSELEMYETDVGAAVALFSGLEVQIGDGLMFTQAKYSSTDSALESFRLKLHEVYTREQVKENERASRSSANQSAKREQRRQTQAVLDQVKRSMGVCSLTDSVDPYGSSYQELQGDPSRGTKGYYQAYLALNAASGALQPVPEVELSHPDRAGLGALKLFTGLEEFFTDVRDEFYIDEFAVSKFSYRTLGLEKDTQGKVKISKELSAPEQHVLANQELEYLLYGGGSCASNYTMAYAEMFAIRLAIGTTEALLEPRNEALAAGSPLLVFLAALAEGAVRAQQDMFKLLQGEEVPLSRKLSGAITLSYKDYLRLFLLLHSKDKVMLSRLQALVQLNTGQDLSKAATYLSGRATTSIRLWFLPEVMKLISRTGFSGCDMDRNRCKLTSTADFTY